MIIGTRKTSAGAFCWPFW